MSDANERAPAKKIFILKPASVLEQSAKSSYELNELRIKGSRLRFDAPNKKIFRDLRTLCVADFKESPISRGRDHWDIEKWRA